MANDDLVEDVAEVGRDREVATLVALLGGQTGPASIDFAATHVASDGHHRVAMPMVRAAIAVLSHRASEFRHREDHRVGHPAAEIRDERGDAASEVVEPVGELPLR